jgi:hypothetical protein
MGGACSTNGREDRKRWSWLNNGEVGWGDVDWIDLAQDRKRRRAIVNSVVGYLLS